MLGCSNLRFPGLCWLVFTAAVLFAVSSARAGDPVGACCNRVTGQCTQTTEAECGGATWTQGRACDPNPCPIGACCDTLSAMCTISGPFGCPSTIFLLGQSCEPNPCPGACCGSLSGCTQTSRAMCAGTWSPGTCFPNPCPGACCNPTTGACSLVPEGACSGPWFPGTCTPSPCPIGACCDTLSAMCTISGPFGCPSTIFLLGQSCEPNPCPGACCGSFSGCTQVSRAMCAGTWSPGTCFPNPCPGACCNLTTGACSLVPEGACSGPWFPGACTPTTCPIGACCDAQLLTCSVTGPLGCQSPGMFLTNASCMPNACPSACCDTTVGACLILPQSACPGLILPGLTCLPNPCPPVALCRDFTFDARADCVSLTITVGDIDNGSRAAIPNCPVTLALDYSGPFPVGDTNVTLTVTDCNNRSSTCTATVTVLGSDCNGNGVPDACECLWDSGPVPASLAEVNGQLSHLGGGSGAGSKVADDFYLCPDHMHRIFDFRGYMLTDLIAPLRKARLELYEDCDGRPAGVPIRTFESTASTELAGPNADGFFLVRYDFDFCNLDPANGGPLWLEGGRAYWWSLVGLGTCPDGTDLSSWAVAPVGRGSRIAGSPPVKADGTGDYARCYPTAFDAWQPLDECCIGCVNMAYSIRGESCPIVWNNGAAITGPSAGGLRSENLGPTQRWRSADDFVAKPCADLHVCLIDAWIWSNCNPVQGFVELYRNDCREPGSPFITLTNPSVIRTGHSAFIDGQTRDGYILRFCGLDLTLPGNQTWWLSAGADRTGSQNTRSYFAYGSRCDAPCPRSGFASQSAVPPLPLRWNDVGPNLAFRIAARSVREDPMIVTGPIVGACRSDINGNGAVTIQDLFDFLAHWFQGCP